MTKYTVEFKTNDGKAVYPKIISIECMEFQILEWTENKQEAQNWNEYDCADDLAMELTNAKVVEI